VIGLFTTDPAGRVITSDAVASRLAAPNGSLIGRAPWTTAAPTRRVEIERAFADWRTGGTDSSRVERFEAGFEIAVDGDWRAARVLLAPRFAEDGTLTEYSGVAIIDDVDPSDAVSRFVATTTDAVLVIDGAGAVTFANAAAHRLMGDAEVARLAVAVRDQIPRALLTEGTDDATDRWRGEVTIRDSIGDSRTLDCSVVRTSSRSFTTLCRDITPSVRLNAELAHQATHDALTGLPNRQLFVRKVAEAVERARVDGRAPAVLYVDIDHLKNVNDSLGHDSGDTFIAVVGRRLSASTRPGDVVGRIGGDEFVVLCEGVGDEATALDLAERVNAAVADPVILHGTRVATGVSIGVAVWKSTDDSGSTIEAALDLVRRADTAMYRAKRRGKGRCEVYSDAMRADARRRVRLGDDLERALADDQLDLVFQAIVATHTGRVDGAEALLRWRHPTEGVLTPSAFLDLAEESGLVVPIGNWVIDESARLLARWIAEGRVDRRFRMHVNVSPRQVIDADFVDHLTTTVRRHGLTPANLGIEYGASSLADAEAVRTLQSLRRLGHLLVIDDFGDDHSSLGHLRSCPSHFVKLHGSFVRSLGQDDRDDPMVRGVIQLAHGLDLSVIASWVGSAEQLARLRALGCDHVQGFHVARPVRADDFDPAGTLRFGGRDSVIE
jgi:diguanylate cyclase (GGDEF)-like protein